MKKIPTFLIAALVAGSFTAANAGGMAEPIIESEVIEAANASSINPAYLLLGLLGLALLVGASSSGTSGT